MNTNKYDYNPVGNRNDRICRKLLEKELISEKIEHTIDVADDSYFWKKDIDIILINKNMEYKGLEVKVDSYGANPNGVKYVFLEFISNSNKYLLSNGKEGKGCLLITQSDYLLFYFIKMDTYMIVETKKLQDFVQKYTNTGTYTVKSASTYGKNGELYYNSYGLLVPIQDLVDEIDAMIYQSRYRFADYAKIVA